MLQVTISAASATILLRLSNVLRHMFYNSVFLALRPTKFYV